MGVQPQSGTPPAESDPGSATFELERFAWISPDRLELAGRFAGVGDAPDEPVLAVRGTDGTRVLEPVSDSASGGPARGPWRAEFAWLEAPSAFSEAQLRLGDDLVVDLPEPRAHRRRFGRQVLAVRRDPEGELTAVPEPPDESRGEPEPEPAQPPDQAAPSPRAQADLLLAREEAEELRTALEGTSAELAAVRATLETERKRHAEAAERFRQDLAAVGASAEQAVASDREAAEAARAEAGALRARLEELEREAAQARDLATQHESSRAALDETRAGLEALLARLAAGGSPDG
jgi:hypothetical protein